MNQMEYLARGMWERNEKMPIQGLVLFLTSWEWKILQINNQEEWMYPNVSCAIP